LKDYAKTRKQVHSKTTRSTLVGIQGMGKTTTANGKWKTVLLKTYKFKNKKKKLFQ
jgi:signal recognition particle GTPase